MSKQHRAVTPVVATILMVAVVVILAATVSVFFLGIVEDINEPPPNVADTTGEFEPEADGSRENQIVRIRHAGGEGVAVEELEIVVRASGPADELPAEARLVNLPATERFISDNVEGDDLIDTDSAVTPMQIIVDDDSNKWSAGDTIQFRIRTGTGGADFREGHTPEADELEVVIVHTPSGAIISRNTFTP